MQANWWSNLLEQLVGDESNVISYIYTYIFSHCLFKTRRRALFVWLIWDLVNVNATVPHASNGNKH